MFVHTHIFLSFIMVCNHLKSTNDVHFIMRVLCEMKQLKKKEDVIFFSMFFIFIHFDVFCLFDEV